MALSEQEQAERLKNWWKKNAAPVLGGVLLSLGAIFGYNWWTAAEEKRREAASDLFAELAESVTAESARIAEEKAAAEAAGDDGVDGENDGGDAGDGEGDGADGDSDAGDDGVDGENDGGDAESADGGGENGDTADAEDDTPEALAQKLREEHGGLDYAAQAAMLVARLAVERGDLAAARGHLRWVADNAAKPATGHAARVRLGRLLLAEGDVDGAAAVAAVEDEGGFVSHYAELRGDIFAARENFTEARAAYQRALAALPLGSAYRDLLELKINNSAGPAQ